MLPMAQRVLDKLIKLIDTAMISVGGAKMAATVLTPSSLWKTSGTVVQRDVM